MSHLNKWLKTVTLLAILSISLATHAGEQFYYQGIAFEATSENTCKVVSPGWYYEDGYYAGNINIPRTVSATVTGLWSTSFVPVDVSLMVTAIADEAFKNAANLTSVTIPSSVTTIGKNAFNGCTGLTELTLPNSIDTIQTAAFSGCTGLTRVTIPNTVRYMGWNVFYGCTALTSATVGSSLRELNGTFANCTSLTNVTIPASVIAIDGAFNNCSSLTGVALPASVIYIGENAFAGCSSLTALRLPSALRHIGDRAFANCGLTTLEIPRTVSSLGENAFYGCDGLTQISVRAINPPAMADSACFSNGIYTNAALLVPAAGIELYKSADWWKLFTDDNVSGRTELDNAYDFEDNGLCYIITGESTVSVTSKEDRSGYSGYLGIPTTVFHEGSTYSVTGIAPGSFAGCTALTGVNIPYTVTGIGAHAFEGCSGLRNLYLPETLTAIGDSAFMNCTGFTSLTVPQSLTVLGKDAFNGLTSLTSLTWNALRCWSNGDILTSGITRVIIGNDVEVLPLGFVAGAPITSVDIPASVTDIGSGAFEGCTGLTALTIPTSVSAIGNNAFNGCTGLTSLTWNAVECWTNGDITTAGLTSVTIGNEVTVLPHRFVMGAPITAINIPAAVVYIGSSAFNSCTGLTSLTIPDAVLSIGSLAFNCCTGLTSLTMGKAVVSIVEDAFAQCDNVTSLTWNAIVCWTNGGLPTSNIEQVTIGNEVEELPWGFVAGSKITHVELPNSLRIIGATNMAYNYYSDNPVGPFFNCSALTEVTIPNSVVTIGYKAFQSCRSLTHIDIPASVTGIDKYAFSNTGLTSFTSGENVNYIGTSAFSSCGNLASITLNDGLRTIGPWAFEYCWSLGEVTIPNTVTSMSKAFNNCGVTYLRLPDGITEIGYEDFRDCWNLQQVIIGNGVRYIGLWAFSNSSITSIDIPDNVVEIESYAFEDCEQLTSFTLGSGCTELGRGVIESCRNLQSVVVSEDNPVFDSRDSCNAIIETATNKLVHGCPATVIPNTVTIIGDFAFGYCWNLTSITIPASVTTIESDAFWYCPDVTSVTCLAKVPPVAADDSFGRIGSNSNVDCINKPLYVPMQSVEAYRNADVWKHFRSITGIEVPDDPVQPGDLNGDGKLGISDVTSLIDAILSGQANNFPAADVNGDGVANIADVTALIDILLTTAH